MHEENSKPLLLWQRAKTTADSPSICLPIYACTESLTSLVRTFLAPVIGSLGVRVGVIQVTLTRAVDLTVTCTVQQAFVSCRN